MLRLVVLSLIITLTISTGVAFSLSAVLGFWQVFVGSFIVQFLLFYIKATKNNNQEVELSSKIDELIQAQTVPVNCPCGKNTITSPIFYNIDNVISCEKCGSKFRVYLNYDTILVTEPLNIENTFDFLKGTKI